MFFLWLIVLYEYIVLTSLWCPHGGMSAPVVFIWLYCATAVNTESICLVLLQTQIAPKLSRHMKFRDSSDEEEDDSEEQRVAVSQEWTEQTPRVVWCVHGATCLLDLMHCMCALVITSLHSTRFIPFATCKRTHCVCCVYEHLDVQQPCISMQKPTQISEVQNQCGS